MTLCIVQYIHHEIAMRTLVLILAILLTFSIVIPSLGASKPEGIVENFAFQPKDVMLSAGKTVIWI